MGREPNPLKPAAKELERSSASSQSKVEFISGFRPILWQLSIK